MKKERDRLSIYKVKKLLSSEVKREEEKNKLIKPIWRFEPMSQKIIKDRITEWMGKHINLGEEDYSKEAERFIKDLANLAGRVPEELINNIPEEYNLLENMLSYRKAYITARNNAYKAMTKQKLKELDEKTQTYVKELSQRREKEDDRGEELSEIAGSKSFDELYTLGFGKELGPNRIVKDKLEDTEIKKLTKKLEELKGELRSIDNDPLQYTVIRNTITYYKQKLYFAKKKR